MSKHIVVMLVGLTLAHVSSAGLTQAVSPYAGEEIRKIKSLSVKEVNDLLDGKGMGLAKPAELNGYPGPMHALELAHGLGLSNSQREGLESSRARMSEKAKALGAEIVALERELDQAFEGRRIDQTRLEDLTARIGLKQGLLRAVHLSAHIETAGFLSAEQIRDYDRLRGYGAVSPQATAATSNHKH